ALPRDRPPACRLRWSADADRAIACSSAHRDRPGQGADEPADASGQSARPLRAGAAVRVYQERTPDLAADHWTLLRRSTCAADRLGVRECHGMAQEAPTPQLRR